MKIGIFALILASTIWIAVASPAWEWDDEDPYFSTTKSPTRPTSRTTTTTPSTSTSNPNFKRCTKRCPTTSEYNPVCGTDNITYNNEGKFLCAKQCGVKADKLHNGVCNPPVTTTVRPTTTPTLQPPVTPSSACLRKCPKTTEYNPICGTDNQTYQNEGRLRCAQQCGVRVQKLFSGTCSTATSSSPRSTVPTRMTTLPPNFRACIRQCIVSSQYVPVCATDGATYDNESQLMCDIRCGKNVTKQKNGEC